MQERTFAGPTARLITPKMIMQCSPCPYYTKEVVLSLWDGAEGLTIEQILRLPIPPEDRIWAATRPGLLGERMAHEFAVACAARALRRERKAGREPEPRSLEALRVKRRWIAGRASDYERSAAYAAAYDAAFAAYATAPAATYDAATAATAATAAAARAAAYAADAAADAADAADDERRWQVSWLLRKLKANRSDLGEKTARSTWSRPL